VKGIEEAVEGNRFIRYTTLENISSQNFSGMEALDMMTKGSLIICRCLHSAIPFCCDL
jgi:hypothetical protein